MPKKPTQKRENKCPSCRQTATEPYKTWELIAPFPNKNMRVTVTMFGMFKCPSCGMNFKGLVGKAKMGAEGTEV